MNGSLELISPLDGLRLPFLKKAIASFRQLTQDPSTPYPGSSRGSSRKFPITRARSEKRESKLSSPARSIALNVVRSAQLMRPTRSLSLSPSLASRFERQMHHEDFDHSLTDEFGHILGVSPKTERAQDRPHLIKALATPLLVSFVEL